METIKDNQNEGYCKGEKCNRNGCKGIIMQHDKEGSCSCHINPPCSYCERSSEYCSECEWDSEEERLEEISSYKPSKEQLYSWEKQRKDRDEREYYFRKIMNGNEAITEFNYRKKSHTHFSMEVEGYFPPEMSKNEVYEKVKGSFGDRFTMFNNGRFRFIAYTD